MQTLLLKEKAPQTSFVSLPSSARNRKSCDLEILLEGKHRSKTQRRLPPSSQTASSTATNTEMLPAL